MLIILDIFMALVIIAGLFGYREIEHLCARGNYLWKYFKKRWYKFADQNNVGEKNKDSFHISNGIAFIGISYFISQVDPIITLWEFWTTLIANTALWWLILMYVRNITMHVIIPKWEKGNPQLRFWFLLPLIGTLIDRGKK
jgi:hypothetical protein